MTSMVLVEPCAAVLKSPTLASERSTRRAARANVPVATARVMECCALIIQQVRDPELRRDVERSGDPARSPS